MTPEISVLISGGIFMTKYTKEIWDGAWRNPVFGGLDSKRGEDVLDRPQQKYTADFKFAAIDRVLLGGEALRQVSLDLGLAKTVRLFIEIIKFVL